MSIESGIALIDPKTGRPYSSAPSGAVVLSSRASGWREDVVLEVQRIAPSELPEHVLQDHRLLVNLGGPTRFGVRIGRRTLETVLPTGGFSLQSHGALNAPFWRDELTLAAVAIQPAFVERLLEHRAPPVSETFREVRHLPEPRAYAFVREMAAELATPTEPLWAETLAMAFTLHLLATHGAAAQKGLSPRGKLSSRQLRAAGEVVRSGLDAAVSIERLAEAAGLSAFHFARLFKATTGRAPHAWVAQLRLERAVRLIRRGSTLADAALACGYFDQAHMTNAFRKGLGVTPASLRASAD
jgi:AraC family transcriptional regulator